MEELYLFDEFYEVENDNEEGDTRYTQKVAPPLYEPSKKKPHVAELVDTTKKNLLIRKIEQSDISSEDKKFLIEAAHRHSVFNYSKIADYYTHSDKEVQELMEESALVIIDMDKAIECGYVKLSKTIADIQQRTGRWANEEYHNQWHDTREEDNTK